jgi:hypothetical protein
MTEFLPGVNELHKNDIFWQVNLSRDTTYWFKDCDVRLRKERPFLSLSSVVVQHFQAQPYVSLARNPHVV